MDIREHMEVVDADGQHVGIVDKVESTRLKLTKKDSLDGHHRFIDRGHIAAIEDNKVKLSQKVSAVTTQAWLAPEE